MRMFLIMLLLALEVLGAVARADPGDPLAVRRWGSDSFSVETMWGLTVFVGTHGSVSADVVIDPTHEPAVGAIPAAGAPGELLHLSVDRLPNSAHVSRLFGVRAGDSMSSNTITVTALTPAAIGSPSAVLLRADGVSVLYLGVEPTQRLLEGVTAVDVLIASRAGLVAASRLRPRLIVPLTDPGDGLPEELLEIAESAVVRAEVGNTTAIADGRGPTPERPRIAMLLEKPWARPAELAELIHGKGRNSAESQALFASMSIGQMNHRPENGSHTPRWNAEHMMGRDLLFFSSIFSKLEPAIVPIDLNPAQMPPDYDAAHPEWSGAEEARQMARAQAFTERFAYLLAGAELDELPAGAPVFAGSLRGLFRVMGRHYPEHTENVRAKSEASDWPSR